MTDPAWRSLHIAYYDDRRDALLIDAVARVFAQTAERAYFVRHWRRGPHLRLNFHTDERTFTDFIRPTAVTMLRQQLAEHPSATHLDQEKLLRLHQRRAVIEGDTGPLTPFYPDNTLHDAEYEPPRLGFAGPAAARLAEDFYRATGPLAFGTIRKIRSGQSKLGLLFDVWVATAHALSCGVQRGYASYRSHADGFRHAAGDRYLTDWDDRYERMRDELADRVEAVLETLDSGGHRSPAARDWVDVMLPFRDRVRSLVDAGQLAFAEPPDDIPRDGRPPSPFHDALSRNENWQAFSRTPEFVSYRVMLTLTYAHASRAGVSLVERFFLCHLAATAMQRRYGLESTELAATLGLSEEQVR